MGVDVLV